jgi:transposase
MLIAHRIALDPTNKQRTYFARASGVARFSYNWGLAEWKRQFEARTTDPSLPQIPGPKAHTALLKRLRRSSRWLSRKQRGSRNALKAKRRLARLHARIGHPQGCNAPGDDTAGKIVWQDWR